MPQTARFSLLTAQRIDLWTPMVAKPGSPDDASHDQAPFHHTDDRRGGRLRFPASASAKPIYDNGLIRTSPQQVKPAVEEQVGAG